MTKSRLQKESNENSGELSHDDCDEGNCARTRPVSLDEIMHRRKNKHMTEGVGVAIGSETIQREDIVDTVPDHSESELEQRRGKNCSSIVKKKESDQYIKSKSRKIEEKADITKCSSTKERRGYDQESDIKPKEKLSKDLVSKLIIDNTGKQGHGRSDDFEAKPEKKHPTESSSMDKHGGRSRERLFQKVHEEKNVDNALKDRHEGRSKEKPDNDRSEERSRDKSANVRHGERNKEKSGIDRHGKREREKSGIDRHGERSVEKSGKDRHGKRNVEKSGKDRHGERNKEKSNNDRHEERAGLKACNDRYGEGNIENSNNCRHGVRNIEKSGSDRHVEMNIEKSGSDRHVEMNREKSGNDRYVERNIEKSGNDRHGKKNKEKSGTDKIEERSRQKSGNDRFEKKRRESPSNERHEEKRKEKHDLTGEQFRGKSGADKYDKRGREKTGNDKYEERSRGREGRDRYEERDRETYERESSRKHCLEDDERYEDKNSTKRHDPGRISELKEKGKSYKHYTEESKLKRRRSRSREHDMEKNRGSLSPRARKRTSCPEKEHGESLNSLKDRPGRQHSDIDINKTSSNGLKVQYRRHSGSASGLGGYSPRKRKTDAAAKTPSPTPRSPDNKRDGSGLPSGGTSNVNFGSVTSNFQSSTQTVKSSIPDPANVTPVALNTMRSLFGAPFGFSAKVTASVDSVQLTEATRPQRRLYVENVPDSLTEKALKEFINNSMLSSCIYHIQGSQPCISCIINKQKCQALVEFLTPEDASAALSFDGSSLAGSILKVRRPKDFVEVAGVWFVVNHIQDGDEADSLNKKISRLVNCENRQPQSIGRLCWTQLMCRNQ